MAPRTAQRRLARIDPHDTAAALQKARARLASTYVKLTEEVRGEISGFIGFIEGTVSEQRLLTYLRMLPLIAARLGAVDFLAPTRDTPARFRAAYRGNQGWTLATAAAIAAKFWRWRFSRLGKEFPSELSVRVPRRNLAVKDVSVVLTPDEVGNLVRATKNSRDKAAIATLYESGCRVGELLGLRIQDVEGMEGAAGYRLHVDGKTGRRTVPLFESAVPLLAVWLKDHPSAGDGTSPLWVNIQVGERYREAINYPAFVKMIREAARRAEVKKDVNPHAFRHSRATAMAKLGNLSPAVLESYLGWRHGSPMAATYVHLVGSEVEDSVARALGVEKMEAPTASHRLARSCPRCSNPNDPQDEFCSRCGAPLGPGGAARLLDAESKAAEFAAFLRRPRVVELLARELANFPLDESSGTLPGMPGKKVSRPL